MLPRQQVESIYMVKIKLLAKIAVPHDQTALAAILRGKSGPLASQYGVSPRTIRDIWNRKTWSYATEHLWPLENEFLSRMTREISSRVMSQVNNTICNLSTVQTGPHDDICKSVQFQSHKTIQASAISSQPDIAEDESFTSTPADTRFEPVQHETMVAMLQTKLDVRWFTSPKYLQSSKVSFEDVLMDDQPIISARWEDPFHQDWLHW